MNFGAIGADVLILVFYIILTIILILFGKLVGKTMYGWYWSIDSGSYKSYAAQEVCAFDKASGEHKCTPKTEEEINKESLERAEEDGRWVGAWIGFLIGGVLSLFKVYNIYSKLKAGNTQ